MFVSPCSEQKCFCQKILQTLFCKCMNFFFCMWQRTNISKLDNWINTLRENHGSFIEMIVASMNCECLRIWASNPKYKRSAGHRTVTALLSLLCVCSRVVQQATRHSQGLHRFLINCYAFCMQEGAWSLYIFF